MYLGLTGLVALMVGGIGVAVSVHAFVRQKLATIAILKASARPGGSCSPLPAPDRAARARRQPARRRSSAARCSRSSRPSLARLLPIALDASASRRSPSCAASRWAWASPCSARSGRCCEIREVPPALILRRDVEPRLRGPAAVARPRCRSRPASPRSRSGRRAPGRSARSSSAASPARCCCSGPRRARSSSRWRAACRVALARLAAGRGQSPPPRQPRGRRARLARPRRDADRLRRAARVAACARSSWTARAEQRARLLLHRHPARPGRGLRAARGRPGAARARRADPRSCARASRRSTASRIARTCARAARTRGILTREYVLTWAATPPGPQHRRGRPLVDARGGRPRAPDLGGGGARASSSGSARRHAHLRRPGRAGDARA